MKTLKRIFKTVISKLDNVCKPQRDFLSELFDAIFSLYGKGNFTNLARFSTYNESTFRRNFAKHFNWLLFNYELIRMYNSSIHISIAAIDCSFIPKSGKKTFGLDKFWSGVSNTTLKGLEISAIAIINVITATAWTLDVCQTPPNFKNSGADNNEYTRVNFYLEQFIDCLQYLAGIIYLTADGFYAKKDVFDTVTFHGKHLITKLRHDANLRYLYEGQRSGGKGAPKKYAGKVFYNDLSKWYFAGIDYKYNYLQIYYKTLNSPKFKRNLKVVLVLNTKTNKYILLASTDIYQDARQIVEYYQLRFQIEFLFRDAKQFACLNHCQARDEQKLDFHFNMSLTAINLVKVAIKENEVDSLNNFVRRSYNNRFTKNIFLKLSKNSEFEINKSLFEEIIAYGSMIA